MSFWSVFKLGESFSASHHKLQSVSVTSSVQICLQKTQSGMHLPTLLKTPRFLKRLARCVLNLSARSHKLHLLHGESQRVISEGRTKHSLQYLLTVGNAKSRLFRVLTCRKHEPVFTATRHTLKGKVQSKIKTIEPFYLFIHLLFTCTLLDYRGLKGH